MVGGRQARADVQELPDPGLARQVLHRAAQERPVGPDAGQDVRRAQVVVSPGRRQPRSSNSPLRTPARKAAISARV
jgi:hypothetical protein